jgi:hypothetical protein
VRLVTYKRRSYSGLFQGNTTNYFQGIPGINIEFTTVKTIGSLYLLKPFVSALQIREIIDRIVPMERDAGRLSHGEAIEQLVLNRWCISKTGPKMRVLWNSTISGQMI